MDVKITFLHGDIHDDVHMQPPNGFVVQGKERMVCKLQKSLYGLKQAPREWYHKFDALMRFQGYNRGKTDLSSLHPPPSLTT